MSTTERRDRNGMQQGYRDIPGATDAAPYCARELAEYGTPLSSCTGATPRENYSVVHSCSVRIKIYIIYTSAKNTRILAYFVV